MIQVTARRSAGRLRSRLNRLQSLSSEQLALVAGLTATASGTISLAQALAGGSRSATMRSEVLWGAALMLGSGLVLTSVASAFSWLRHRRPWPPGGADGGAVISRALWWAAIGWCGLMMYPATLALSRNPYRDVTWLAWGTMDQRGLSASYLVTIVAAVALPALASRSRQRRPAT